MKSPLMAVSNPFVFGEFQVYEGRDSYTLSSANIKEYFLDLAQMQPGVYYGFISGTGRIFRPGRKR